MIHRLAITAVAFAIFVGLSNEPSNAQSALTKKLDPKNDSLRGQIEAFRNTEVATTEVGIVRKVHVKPGDVVKAGQILAVLDDEPQRIRVEAAEIEYEAQGTLETAERELEFSYRKYLTSVELAKKQRTSPLELERDTLEWHIAESKLLVQKDAKDVAASKLKEAREALARRTIVAPHDGIVVEVFHDEGEYIAANQPAIVRIWDISKLRARFYLSDEFANRMRGMEKASVRLLNGVILSVNVEYIAPVASVDSTELTVVIDNPNHEIRSSSCDLIRP